MADDTTDAPLTDSPVFCICLLYTSDAADERSSVDLGGRRIIKKKKLWMNARHMNKQIANNETWH